jgi:hypothetical protein
MRMRKDRLLAVALAGFGVSVLTATLFANPTNMPPFEQVYYDGKIMYMEVPQPTVNLPPGPFNKLYAVVDPAITVLLQPAVLSKIPGDAGFSPRWEFIAVFVTDGRDVSTNPFKSDDEILAAQAAGKVAVTDLEFSFYCPVVKEKP